MNIPKSLMRFICEHARSDHDKKKAISLLHSITFSVAEYDVPRNSSIEQQLFVLLGFPAGPGPAPISPATQLLMDEFHQLFQQEKTKYLDQLAATATAVVDSEDEDARELAQITKKIRQRLNKRAVPY